MRVDPADVYLRLEPGAHLINRTTGDVRSVPCVELHWKDGNRWQRRSFVADDGTPTLGAVLSRLGEWIDSCESLDDMLTKAGKPMVGA